MGSFDGPIKLTFSLDARRTVITKVVGSKGEERDERGSEKGRRPKSDEALSLSFNPIVRASIARSLARTDSLGGAGDIWLSDDPILMSPIVVACARAFAHPAATAATAAAMTKTPEIHKCFAILSSSRPSAAPPARPAHPPLHPTEEAITIVSFILAPFSAALFWSEPSEPRTQASSRQSSVASRPQFLRQ